MERTPNIGQRIQITYLFHADEEYVSLGDIFTVISLCRNEDFKVKLPSGKHFVLSPSQVEPLADGFDAP